MVNTRVMALLQQRAVAAITEARERGETGAIDARSFVFDDDFRTLDIYPTGAAPAAWATPSTSPSSPSSSPSSSSSTPSATNHSSNKTFKVTFLHLKKILPPYQK